MENDQRKNETNAMVTSGITTSAISAPGEPASCKGYGGLFHLFDKHRWNGTLGPQADLEGGKTPRKTKPRNMPTINQCKEVIDEVILRKYP